MYMNRIFTSLPCLSERKYLGLAKTNDRIGLKGVCESYDVQQVWSHEETKKQCWLKEIRNSWGSLYKPKVKTHQTWVTWNALDYLLSTQEKWVFRVIQGSLELCPTSHWLIDTWQSFCVILWHFDSWQNNFFKLAFALAINH